MYYSMCRCLYVNMTRHNPWSTALYTVIRAKGYSSHNVQLSRCVAIATEQLIFHYKNTYQLCMRKN